MMLHTYHHYMFLFKFAAAPPVDQAQKRDPFNNTRNIMDTHVEIGNKIKPSCGPYLDFVLTFHIWIKFISLFCQNPSIIKHWFKNVFILRFHKILQWPWMVESQHKYKRRTNKFVLQLLYLCCGFCNWFDPSRPPLNSHYRWRSLKSPLITIFFSWIQNKHALYF